MYWKQDASFLTRLRVFVVSAMKQNEIGYAMRQAETCLTLY